MGFQNGVKTVGTGTATQIVTVGSRGAVVQNVGPTTLYLGGPGVTADTSATGGVQLTSANGPLQMLGGSTEFFIGGAISDAAVLYATSSGSGGKLAFICETSSF